MAKNLKQRHKCIEIVQMIVLHIARYNSHYIKAPLKHADAIIQNDIVDLIWPAGLELEV